MIVLSRVMFVSDYDVSLGRVIVSKSPRMVCMEQ